MREDDCSDQAEDHERKVFGGPELECQFSERRGKRRKQEGSDGARKK